MTGGRLPCQFVGLPAETRLCLTDWQVSELQSQATGSCCRLYLVLTKADLLPEAAIARALRVLGCSYSIPDASEEGQAMW